MTRRERPRWALILHGGAKEIEPGEEAANRTGLRRALEAGRRVLEEGGTAIAAVEAAVRVLEDDPAFNAGYGSALNIDGEVEMCAAVMNGRDLSVGAVGVLPGVRHPVSVAREMLKQRETLVAGPAARRFAENVGAELCRPEDLITPKQEKALADAHDTVGAVALDQAGNLACATSTGGLPGAAAGRMGDSALPGCGFYADNEVGAVALSGDGEAIARLATAARVMEWLRTQAPEAALCAALAPLPRLAGDGGGVAIARDGRMGWWHNSPAFAVAEASSTAPDGEIWLGKDRR